MRRIVLHDLAQPRDLYVDRAVEHLVFAPAGELHQLVARERLARMLHQDFEHRELAGSERHALPLARERPGGEVQLEAPEAMRLRSRRRRPGGAARRTPAQYRVDPGEKLARIEGLGQVVIGAHLQADDAVDIVALGGEHDDRRCRGLRAQPPADGKPVLAWQHEIEDHQVVALACELLVHAARIGHRLHLVALAAEVAHQEIAQALVVVDDEDAGLELGHKYIVTKFGQRDTPWPDDAVTMRRAMKAAILVLALVLATGNAFAQRERVEGKPRPGPGMSKDERQRMREDMRDVYRERDRGARPERPRQMSPEEREKLRRDIQNANKDLKR